MKISQPVVALVLGIAALGFPGVSNRAVAQAAAPSAPATPSPPVVETVPAFTVVGVSVRTSHQKEAGGNGLIPPLWQQAIEQNTLDSVPHRADNNLTVVYTDFAGEPSGEYTYVLGARVTAVDKIPQGMVAVNIPAGKYAVVQSDTGPLQEVIPKVWQRIFAMTPAELGGQRAFKADFEIYPEGFDYQNAQITVHLGLK